MRKLRLELDSVSVDSFATGRETHALRGTMHAHGASGLPCDATHNGCPTQFCATVPLLCETVFAPQCTGTTCTG
ncbi:MAG TPA: hypothetical protein VF092_20935 [Longimicrobium sp.]